MKQIFAPGCALILYKPELAQKMADYLAENHHVAGQLTTCCNFPGEELQGTRIINMCPGCDRDYRAAYGEDGTVSLLEILAESDTFDFPDYDGLSMTILDACPVRTQDRIHKAIRAVADKMNITIVEPAKTRSKSTCCGDTFYGQVPTEEVLEQMKTKADSLPEENVIVYCVSCKKSMFNGGKKPRYIIDLLFGEETVPGTLNPDKWHNELDEFIEDHSDFQVVQDLSLVTE